MLNYVWLIPAIPLASFVLVLLLGRALKSKSAAVAIGAGSGSFVISLAVFAEVIQGARLELSFPWIVSGSYTISLGILVDPLTALMLTVVTLVSLLVQVYSLGYMKGDKGFSWYYAALSLFTFSMLGLILADNYLMLYVFWELVGLCSYLLIGFWFEKKSASDAAKKAFITTRIGDVGLLLGILLLFGAAGTFKYGELFSLAQNGSFTSAFLTTATLLLFAGAVGKSAQFPLHVWLPDAMEGPTPVSALIHAATMVAAGVYLVSRSFPLFELAPTSLLVVTLIGAFTAFMAATIATVMNDIKKVLAYSTISQLGYMMMALGVGSATAAIFHLTTHAFFKALLFLGSGSIIHATKSQDLTEMGGLSRRMKITTFTFLIGALSLSGIFPLSGFWSKDEILSAAFSSGNTAALAVGLMTAFLTAFYMFRLCFLVFFGEEKESASHAHESPLSMTLPLVTLAGLTLVAGFFNSPLTGNALSHFLGFERDPAIGGASLWLMGLSSAIALAGIGTAWAVYQRRIIATEPLVLRFSAVYSFLSNKYWLDELYAWVIVKPVLGLSALLGLFDLKAIDGMVNGVSSLTVRLSAVAGIFDLQVIDGAVNGVGMVTKKVGDRLRYVQTGFVQNYAAVMFIALIVMAVWFVF
jgi:NADH-quinone oxidoreductase subunit L